MLLDGGRTVSRATGGCGTSMSRPLLSSTGSGRTCSAGWACAGQPVRQFLRRPCFLRHELSSHRTGILPCDAAPAAYPPDRNEDEISLTQEETRRQTTFR
jgi:hypothetical protein